MKTERITAVSIVFALSVFGCTANTAAGPTPTPDTGPGDVANDSVVPETTSDTPVGDGTACSAARDSALGPVDKVSTGAVTVLDDTGGTKTLFVDATAGDFSTFKNYPWVYINLGTATRVDITDKQSYTSLDWDLAIKRPILHTNSGDAGLGVGGAKWLPGKAFDAVTAADATSLKIEQWFDADCVLQVDATGSVKTTFDAWYDYDGATSKIAPKAGVFIVRGAKGDLYKLEIQGYYSKPDGTVGTVSGNYKLRYAPLK